VTKLGDFGSREHPLREVISSHFSESFSSSTMSVCLFDRQGRAGRQGQGDRGRAGRPGEKTWEILGYDFQDMVFRTWDLNFGAWIFTLAVSKTET
jgi:hypothetical protein